MSEPVGERGGPRAAALEKTPPDDAATPLPGAASGGPGGMEQAASAARYEPDGETEDGPVRRFWSVRRVPAAIVGLVLLAAFALLLYDIASVRADRPATAWRRGLAEELGSRTLDDIWVVLGAVAAVLLGCWLIALALTPGLRGLLPMRRERADLRAGIERDAAALVLRDRALDVSGVRSVQVYVGRRRVRVWAQAHFRDLDDVRADLDAVLGHGIGQLGLARRLALTVQVRRPTKG